jgi:CHAD domain-containing protein
MREPPGRELSTGETLPAVKALPIKYPPGASLDDAFSAVISNTLAQFVGNFAPLRMGDQPEAVHQARVALRRLRAALKMFKRAIACPQFDAIQHQARQIASAFGPARECDAFLEAVVTGPLAHASRSEGTARLLASVEERRAVAYRSVRAVMEDPDTTRFVLNVYSFLARHAWRDALTGTGLEQLAGPAEVFARKALDRLHARAAKRGQNLAELPDEARHELRIALKNLRYCAEFFGDLFGRPRKIRRYIRTVAALQELLGVHNDIANARCFLNELPAGTESASGFILGWYARENTFADAELIKVWKTFRKSDPFWR